MAEKVTRGEIRQALELLLRLNPSNFEKELIYARLAPIVSALAEDLGKTQKKKSPSQKGQEK